MEGDKLAILGSCAELSDWSSINGSNTKFLYTNDKDWPIWSTTLKLPRD